MTSHLHDRLKFGGGRSRIHFAWILAATLAPISAVTAQDVIGGREQPKSTFSGATEYVEVPVIVQRGGKHVSGLTKADFTLAQDGKEQPISTFEVVHSAVSAVADESAASFGNTYVSGQNIPQIVILAIDTVNTPPMDQAYFREELKSYLSEIKPEDPPLGVVELTRNGLHVIHDFTLDRKALLEEIDKLSKLPTRNDDQSLLLSALTNEAQQLSAEGTDMASAQVQRLVNNTNSLQSQEQTLLRFQDNSARIDSLMALQQLAQTLKGIPGRKTLLWAGSGFPFVSGLSTNGQGGRGFNPDRIGESLDMHAYTWKLLNDANVAVYPIDLRRTVNTAFEVMDPSLKYSPTAQQKEDARSRDSQVLTTFETIAAQTGGKACIYRTDLHNCIREAADDNRDYYLLGFYVDKNNRSPGYHKVSVKLDQKASIRYREGFIVTPSKPDAVRSADLQLALNSPFAYTSLPFSGKFVGFEPDGDKQSVKFELRIPPAAISVADSKIDFDILAVVRAPGGNETARISQHIERSLQPGAVATIQSQGINYTNKVAVPPGEYGVWFVLRDNPTGRTGSVSVRLNVQ